MVSSRVRRVQGNGRDPSRDQSKLERNSLPLASKRSKSALRKPEVERLPNRPRACSHSPRGKTWERASRWLPWLGSRHCGRDPTPRQKTPRCSHPRRHRTCKRAGTALRRRLFEPCSKQRRAEGPQGTPRQHGQNAPPPRHCAHASPNQTQRADNGRNDDTHLMLNQADLKMTRGKLQGAAGEKELFQFRRVRPF
jgi:hypothetical protein